MTKLIGLFVLCFGGIAMFSGQDVVAIVLLIAGLMITWRGEGRTS